MSDLMDGGGLDEELPRNITPEWLAYRWRDMHRRIGELERRDERYNPAVVNERLENLAKEDANLAKEVTAMKKAFYGLMAAIVIASLTVAFTVLTTLGHP